MRLAVLAGSLLGLAAGGALGQPAPPPKTVAPLTVYALTDPPKLVSSYPAAGETIAPGVLVVRVTFDQPMAEDGFDFSPGAEGHAPKCLKTPRRLNDEKTFVLLCTIAPNSRYALALNAGAAADKEKRGFANLGGARLAPVTLAFATNGMEGPQSVADAMKAAKLTDIDMPILEGMYF
jgi:hypothetical protein